MRWDTSNEKNVVDGLRYRVNKEHAKHMSVTDSGGARIPILAHGLKVLRQGIFENV